MKKSTIIMIFVIYIASIFAIGFFGMKVKVYDEVKYIEKIEMSVEAERDEMFEFELLPDRDKTTQNLVYELTIYYTKYSQEGTFFNEETQEDEIRQYLAMIFVPKIYYDTGEEGSSAEGITYSVSNKKLIENRNVDMKENGTLINYKGKMSYFININPNSNGKSGSGAIVHVFVI